MMSIVHIERISQCLIVLSLYLYLHLYLCFTLFSSLLCVIFLFWSFVLSRVQSCGILIIFLSPLLFSFLSCLSFLCLIYYYCYCTLCTLRDVRYEMYVTTSVRRSSGEISATAQSNRRNTIRFYLNEFYFTNSFNLLRTYINQQCCIKNCKKNTYNHIKCN